MPPPPAPPPLEVLEPAGDVKSYTLTHARADAAAAAAKDADADKDKEKNKRVRPLNVLTHFRKGDETLSLSLKVKLPPTWDDKTIDTAVIQPFVAAYDKKYPDNKASVCGPFSRVKVLVWKGPTPCAADRFKDPEREGVEDIKIAETPIWALMESDEPISMLRARAHNKLKPTVELELVQAESTAIVLRTVPSTALLVPGEKLLTMLTDPSSDPEEMHQIIDAAIAGGELAYLGVSTARDRNGKNPLHLASTRGDATLCRKLLRRREDVFAMDSNRDMAIHIAAMAGRQMVIHDLLNLGALVHEKNRDLMLPLNLAVVEEAQGNGEVVRMLVEHGADIDAKCWDVTPLMAAAAGGHHWGIETLVELGADINIRNGYEMMALDYARDQDTSEMLYDVMRGFFLPDPKMVKDQEEMRKKRQQNAQMFGGAEFKGMGMPGEQKEPRLFQASRRVPLPAAFAALAIDESWLDPFKKSGEHYKQIRLIWRTTVLKSHPDRLPSTISDEDKEKASAEYMKAMAAFEAIDIYYNTHFADKPVFAADAAAAKTASSAADAPRQPTGGTAEPAEPPVDVSDATRKKGEDEEPYIEEISTDPNDNRNKVDVSAFIEKNDLSDAAKKASERASRPLLLKRRVEVHGLQAKPEFNGRKGRVVYLDRNAGRYHVQLEKLAGDKGGGEKLKVKEANLKVAPEEDE